MRLNPIDRLYFEASRLMAEHPPQWRHPNKRIVYEIACSSGFPFTGQIVYARWPAQPLPKRIPELVPLVIQPGWFSYAPSAEPTAVAWHVNFAGPQLFFAYGSLSMAQSELQVAEHPTLGALREALTAKGRLAVTVEPARGPTPVTVTGVQRRCVIEAQPHPTIGSKGLYDNAFACATEAQVRKATRPLVPPTLSNILAMSALPGGRGPYSRNEIEYTLITAYTGFLAARSESERLMIPQVSRTVIHTGFWGCGAFGGNRRLMTVLQGVAGTLAGVNLVFWAGDEAGSTLAADAWCWVEQLQKEMPTVERLLERLVEERFMWGVSNGG